MKISNFNPTTVTINLLSSAAYAGRVNFCKLPSSHPKPPCVQQTLTRRTSGYGTRTSKFSGNIRNVFNFSPFHQTFLVIFLSRLPVADCQRMCTQHPFRFATCLSLCGLRKLVTAFGWFDWSSGNGSWWRWDLQCCQIPGGVIFQHKNRGIESYAHCLVKTVFRFHLQATKPVITAWQLAV